MPLSRHGADTLVLRPPRYAGIVLLVIAALVVAVAILTSGAISRGVNGAGGILWLISLILIWRDLGRGDRPLMMLAGVLAITVVLVLVVKPSDVVTAALGFGCAGLLAGLAARRQEVMWAAMIPALWLPVHLSIAISRAVLDAASERAATVRTDPPPTEAFVPFMMVVAAVAGGLAVAAMRRSRAGDRVAGRPSERQTGLDRAQGS